MKIIFSLCLLFLSTTLGQEVVQVLCTEASMTARIQKDVVETAGYTLDDLHLNDDTCIFTTDDGEFFEREVSPLSSCGTDVSANDTHVIFTNSISTVETGSTYPYGVVVGSQTNARVLSAVVSCTYRIDLNVSTLFIPNITIITIPLPSAFGVGEFQAMMRIFHTAAYQDFYQTPPIVDADQMLYVGVNLIGEVSSDVYLLMEECWGTISNDPSSSPKYPLIDSGCAVPTSGNGIIRVTENGIGHQALWQTPVFKFVGEGEAFDNVWLHCNLQLCINAACEPTCSARRKRRSLGDGNVFGPGDFISDYIISLGPITRLKVTHISANETRIIDLEVDESLAVDIPGSSSSENKVGISLSPAVIGIIAAISAVAAISFIIAGILVARIRRSRSDGVDLGGITNKAFS